MNSTGASKGAQARRAIGRLAQLFHRNGYVRWQNAERLLLDGYMRYKKGDEVRLVAKSRAELKEIRRLLRLAGFKTRRPFSKGRQFRQPIYGRGEVARFLALLGQDLGPLRKR